MQEERQDEGPARKSTLNVLRYVGLLLILGLGAIEIVRTYLRARSFDEHTEALERSMMEGGEKVRWPDPAELERRAANAKAGGLYQDAETLYTRALGVCAFGKVKVEDKVLTALMCGLADVYSVQGKHKEAERLYGSALDTCQGTQPLDHDRLLNVLEGYAELLRQIGRQDEAEELEARAKTIRRKSGGRKVLQNLTRGSGAGGKNSEAIGPPAP